jgi:hypothetical protein
MVLRVRIPRLTKTRPGTFTLRAEPRLRQDELLRGYLDYIVFRADTTRGLFLWHAHRHSHLVADFSALVPEETAIQLVKNLHQGQTIELPGRHKLELLKGRFGFQGR